MPLAPDEKRRLVETAREVRRAIVDLVFASGSGHIGTALGQTELLVALYYKVLALDPKDLRSPDRDRFVLSKGHGGLGLVPILADKGVLDAAEVATFGETGSRLGMHMDHQKVPGIEHSTGSLGHGVGVAVGMALGAKVQRQGWRTYCLLSDGECYEGSIWEAALAAPAYGLSKLTLIVDRNRLTMDGPTEERVPLEPLAAKWAAFGWRVLEIDGHDLDAICAALEPAPGEKRPTVVIARTVKGRGVEFMEDAPKWHYGALDSADHARALASIERRP
jgi:transketolase